MTPLDEIITVLGDDEKSCCLCQQEYRARWGSYISGTPEKRPIKVRLIQFNRDYSLSLQYSMHSPTDVQDKFLARGKRLNTQTYNIFMTDRNVFPENSLPTYKTLCFMETLCIDWSHVRIESMALANGLLNDVHLLLLSFVYVSLLSTIFNCMTVLLTQCTNITISFPFLFADGRRKS